MKDIDDLCKKNDIEYYLLGGSAIGAVRHKGFIPWDDDLDIVMTPDNYSKFISVCKQQLDREKYVLIVGLEDYPLNFSKVRLRGTHLKEYGFDFDSEHDGIYLDIFKLENSPSSRFSQGIQYFFAKYFLCYQLSQRGFNNPGFKKRVLMALSMPLKIKCIRDFVKSRVERYGPNSAYYGSFYFRTRFKTAFTKKEVFGHPLYFPFEDMTLPVPEHYDEYLTQMFGDYMTPPPVEKRVGLHLIDVDFGKY